jgi:hypothetical protein
MHTKYFIGKHEGNTPLGRPRCRCKVNIRMDLRETGWKGVNWILVAQDSDQRQAL